MKTKGWIFLLALAAIGWVSCNNNDDDNTSSLGTADRDFIQNAGARNSSEIELGQLAATNGNDSRIVAFGQQLVTEHTAAQTELQTLAGKYTGFKWTIAPDSNTQSRRKVLDSLSGFDFDSAFIASQVVDLTKALPVFTSEVDNGNDQSLKDYATKYSPQVQMHLKRADSLRTLILASHSNSRKN